MNYSSKEAYKNRIKARKKFRKANDYEVFFLNICLECRYYRPEQGLPFGGTCSLMEREGAYNGVMATAVCNRYVNTRGFDINGKVVDSDALPKCIKTRTDKRTGQTFIAV